MNPSDRFDPEELDLARFGNTGRVVDHLLGAEDEAERAAFRVELESDLALATEVAETRHLFEGLRELSVEPSGRVERELRRAITHRLRLRGIPAMRGWGHGTAGAGTWRERFDVAVRVAAVALITLGCGAALFGPRGLLASLGGAQAAWPSADVAAADLPAGADLAHDARPPVAVTRDPELRALLDPDRLPIDDPAFVGSVERFGARPVPDEFRGLMSAENLLASLRAESDLRYSSAARHRAQRATGAPDIDDRVESLADQVADRAVAALAAQDGDTDAVAFALRGLVAAGSDLERGEHPDVVRACRDALIDRLPLLGGSARATALAALSDLAVLGDVATAERIGVEADRLARETIRGTVPGGRPELLHWQTPAYRLADAGRVFLIAPAFGTHAGLAFRARLLVASHVEERLASRPDVEQPSVVGALLYGFGDLIDRREADRRLSLWRLRMLEPDFVALHHIAWSKYPVRPGWAEFQRELRALAAVPTPVGLRDPSALLLGLCTNRSAPGVGEGLGVALL